MLLGTLGASLSVNMLTGKGKIIARKGILKGKLLRIFNVASNFD